MFISFEGIDGAGKTTQCDRLAARLQSLGKPLTRVREPGGTPLGERIRALLLDVNEAPAAATEVLLYAASRAQLVQQVIRPALAEGRVVLCDRFVDASLAYQGAGLGLGVEPVRAVNEMATGGLLPDVTFLLDLPVAVGRARLAASGQPRDRMEQRDEAYFERVRAALLDIAGADSRRVRVVDATQPEDAIEKEIWNHIANWFI
ncbi:dTMP kinase [Alicyclobacillus shizuokensis]|uniref:dTMP kinase n=1 Tax=Alicyclobacillus shizuokensis TaxID=392014 RepID=UPI00082C55BB|nr:dTMP kinase [Alicyclobacillus shizuokensis]MCL6626996.1 dTMP kinase [Alicyclobacillus shizuokensis]